MLPYIFAGTRVCSMPCSQFFINTVQKFVRYIYKRLYNYMYICMYTFTLECVGWIFSGGGLKKGNKGRQREYLRVCLVWVPS